MYVIGAKHNVNGEEDITEIIADDLFLLMGSNMELLQSVHAGNILGIGSIEHILIKTGLVTSEPSCPNFAQMKLLGTGLVKVAVEAKNLAEMVPLIDGLKKLNKADPAV